MATGQCEWLMFSCINHVLLLTDRYTGRKPAKWFFSSFCPAINCPTLVNSASSAMFPKCFSGLDQSPLCSLTFSIKGDRGVETVLLWNRSALRAGKSHFTACGCPVWSLCQHIPSRVCKALCEGEHWSMVNGALLEMPTPGGDGEMNNQWHSSMATCEQGVLRTAKSI